MRLNSSPLGGTNKNNCISAVKNKAGIVFVIVFYQ